MEKKKYEVDDIIGPSEYETRKIIYAQGTQYHDEDLRHMAEMFKDESFKPAFDYLSEKLGSDFKVQENPGPTDGFTSVRKIGKYRSEVQKVDFVIIVVVSKKDFKLALETEGVHVMYGGHSRYGRGACFGDYTGVVSNKGELWGDGSNENEGFFRLGFSYVPVSLLDIEHHGYSFAPLPVEDGAPPSEGSHPYSRHRTARRSLRSILLPENLRGKVSSFLYESPSNQYYGLTLEGKPHLLLRAGWERTVSDPYDLGAVDLKCKVFCHFGCSSQLHFWEIVRRSEYKGWERPKPPTDKYAYFTSDVANVKLWPLWLYYVLTYNKKNNFKPWWDSLRWAKLQTNKKLRTLKLKVPFQVF